MDVHRRMNACRKILKNRFEGNLLVDMKILEA